MTNEQAIQNLENLISVALQRGLFQNPSEVILMQESLDNLKKKESNIPESNPSILEAPNGQQYYSTKTSDIKEK